MKGYSPIMFKLLSLLHLFVFPLYLFAQSQEFDFKDPKGVNAILFHLDAPLESISGSGNDISGQVEFDPKKPEATKGKIILQSKSLHVGNPVLKEHMHGDDWLQVAKFPNIKFTFDSLGKIKKKGNDYIGEAIGKMTIKNVTIAMVIPVKITHLKDLLEKRNRVPGDLLIVRSKFSVRRDDFNIQKGKNLDKVANQIDIILNLAGACPKK